MTDETRHSIDGAARDYLKAFVSRIERLEEDKANAMADTKKVHAELKSMGFDVKAMLELYLGAVES
jgi:uncharacterized protein (UPF0335 family)